MTTEGNEEGACKAGDGGGAGSAGVEEEDQYGPIVLQAGFWQGEDGSGGEAACTKAQNLFSPTLHQRKQPSTSASENPHSSCQDAGKAWRQSLVDSPVYGPPVYTPPVYG